MGSDTDRGQSAAEKALVGREQFFVQDVLSESEENLTRKYKLKRQGLDFEKVLDKVSSILERPPKRCSFVLTIHQITYK
jgi:hypothetical protein